MRCFILAGGFATRLWPLTERRAKPLLPLAGRPLLTHLVEKLPRDLSVTISTNAVFAQDFRRWTKTCRDRTIEVIVEDTGHDDHKLGALGATAKWLTEAKIDDDVLLLAGDNYVGFSLEEFVKVFRGNPLIAAHDIGEREKAKAFGTIIVERPQGSPMQQVTGFEEKPKDPKSTLVSTGCWILPTYSLPILTEYAKRKPDNVGGIFEELLNRKLAIDCFLSTAPWRDIGSFDSYMAAHCAILGGRQEVDPSSSVTAAKLSGSVSVGPESKITRSTLTDCIVFGASRIDGCVLESCIVDEGCELGGIDLRGKMLRAGTVLRREGKQV